MFSDEPSNRTSTSQRGAPAKFNQLAVADQFKILRSNNDPLTGKKLTVKQCSIIIGISVRRLQQILRQSAIRDQRLSNLADNDKTESTGIGIKDEIKSFTPKEVAKHSGSASTPTIDELLHQLQGRLKETVLNKTQNEALCFGLIEKLENWIKHYPQVIGTSWMEVQRATHTALMESLQARDRSRGDYIGALTDRVVIRFRNIRTNHI